MHARSWRRLTTPRHREQVELLDNPSRVLSDLPGNLADIRRLNRWFGGTRLVINYLDPLLSRAHVTTILDVATGSADIPLAVDAWAHRAGIQTDIVGLDLYDEVLMEARRVVNGSPIRLCRGDARALPFPNNSFDVVLCSLALHHFPPRDAVIVLAEMRRVARRAMLVVDLTRGYAGHAGAWLATRTMARNRLTRHDGPLSVLRSFTSDELAALAERAGISNAVVRRHAFFRQALLAHKETFPHD